MTSNNPIVTPRIESYTLEEGTGRIAVLGNGAISGLFLDSKPFLLNWCDYAGSIGQELYRFGAQFENGLVRDLANITLRLPEKHEALSALVLPLLRQFNPGIYQLILSSLAPDEGVESYCLGNDKYSIEHYPGTWYYPDGGNVLLTTQPWDQLNEDRILHFWQMIENGERPFAVTTAVEDGMCEFVLDGHHKLAAYIHARIPAWRLCITTTSLPLTANDWPQDVAIPLTWYRVNGITP